MSSSSPSLMYFPFKEFSPRYGDNFFTMKFEDYRIVDSGCFTRYIVFDIAVRRGKRLWIISKRFSEIYALGNCCIASLPTELTRTIAATIPTLPPKTFCSVNVDDKEFIEERQAVLERFLDELLKYMSAVKMIGSKEIGDFFQLL